MAGGAGGAAEGGTVVRAGVQDGSEAARRCSRPPPMARPCVCVRGSTCGRGAGMGGKWWWWWSMDDGCRWPLAAAGRSSQAGLRRRGHVIGHDGRARATRIRHTHASHMLQPYRTVCLSPGALLTAALCSTCAVDVQDSPRSRAGRGAYNQHGTHSYSHITRHNSTSHRRRGAWPSSDLRRADLRRAEGLGAGDDGGASGAGDRPPPAAGGPPLCCPPGRRAAVCVCVCRAREAHAKRVSPAHARARSQFTVLYGGQSIREPPRPPPSPPSLASVVATAHTASVARALYSLDFVVLARSCSGNPSHRGHRARAIPSHLHPHPVPSRVPRLLGLAAGAGVRTQMTCGARMRRT